MRHPHAKRKPSGRGALGTAALGLALFLLLAAPRARAQEIEMRWSTHSDASFVNAIRSFDGRIWAATEGGLIVFDPADSGFTRVTTADGLPQNVLWDVGMDGDGRVWVATADVGLVSFLPGPAPRGFLHFTGSSVVSDQVRCLDVQGDLVAYGTTQGAGTFFAGAPGDLITAGPGGLPDPQVNAVAIDGVLLWFATSGGVAVLFPDGRVETVNDGLTSLQVNDILVEGGSAWAATADGVYAFDDADSTWESTGAIPLGQLPVRSLARSGNVLYQGGENGVMANSNGADWIFVDQSGQNAIYRGVYNLGSLRTTVVATSPDGAVWCGSGFPGKERGANLSVYDGGGWRNLAPNGPLNNRVLAMSLGPDGTLWTSHRYRGISYLREGMGWNGYTELRGPGDVGLTAAGFQFCLLADRQGILWSSPLGDDLDELHYGSLGTRSDDLWDYHEKGDGTITSTRHLRGLEDPGGNRWFLSDDDDGSFLTSGNEGIDILGAGGTQWISRKSVGGTLAGPSVPDAAFYPGGEIYLAVNTVGIQRWSAGSYDAADLAATDPSTGPLVLDSVDLPGDRLIALEGTEAALWVGTDGGLLRLDRLTGELDTLTAKVEAGEPGLLSAEVNDLLLDVRGDLWVATGAGLNVLRQEDMNRIDAYTTNLALRRQVSFDYPSRVLSPLVDSRCVALAESPDGRILYVGTVKGISRIEFVERALPAPVLDEIYLYPNPVNAALGHSSVKIGRLDRPAAIRVYTVEGELVHEQQVGGAGEEIWDLTTLNGFKARSGTYLVRIEVDGRATVRVLAVAK
jgi:ligand-binding sensor domain-containing protein